ncbi:YybH family protein [Sinosporangium siamense]|uniref:SnoaL-like domain-containing protein n=1 Tax=Sinosporangium siamense TaxID=1367973 RepID=A0A919RDU1_9ACTN|nr:hypothetical protein [Sinosporangium siamense]GII90041.1 hypothetical protein Ssi02_02720 [Sinosporangium siamense]
MKRNTCILSVAITALLLAVGNPVSPTAARVSVAMDNPSVVKNHNSPAHVTTQVSAGSMARSIPRPAARTPAELLRLLSERILAKDLDGIIALHEPEAAVVLYDGSIARGHRGIRAMYVDWFTSDPVLTVNPRQTVEAGGSRGWDGKIRGRTASVMGDYTLEQNRPDGTRDRFTGNFCDIVREQPNGTWLYVQDNPYPPHGVAHH